VSIHLSARSALHLSVVVGNPLVAIASRHHLERKSLQRNKQAGIGSEYPLTDWAFSARIFLKETSPRRVSLFFWLNRT
jgi:hypothetical protein